MKCLEIIKLLQQAGWSKARQKGSHAIFIKPGQRCIAVPIHSNKDVPVGTARAILRQAGIKVNNT